jgi:hypothetical protein
MARERTRRPDLDERFAIDADPEEVLKRLLDGAGTEDVSDEADDEEDDPTEP